MPIDGKIRVEAYRAEPTPKRRHRLKNGKRRIVVRDKISIVKSVLCDGEYQADVAREFQIT